MSTLRSYATILVPSLLTAPRYFSGEVEFGVITLVCLSSLHTFLAPTLGWSLHFSQCYHVLPCTALCMQTFSARTRWASLSIALSLL